MLYMVGALCQSFKGLSDIASAIVALLSVVRWQWVSRYGMCHLPWSDSSQLT